VKLPTLNLPSGEVTMSRFKDKYGPWAFVAGASMGIGAALSNEAAARGLNVLMLARGAETLEEAAATVRDKHHVDVRTLSADLTEPTVVDEVARAVEDIDVGLFVYNAAIAPAGPFLDVDIATQLASISANCATPLALCHLLARPMVDRGRGGIALIGSNAANAGAVKFAAYHAGKAFQWILAESLWAELGDHGVDATCIFVGATDGANYKFFMDTLDPELCNQPNTDDPLERARARLMKPTPPQQVARALYDQLGSGPVCFADPDDEWVSRRCMAMERVDAIKVWRGVQETSLRLPDKQAL
jgi:short-subunit dehydrogenase